MFKPLASSALIAFLLSLHISAAEREIYFTDFEDAPVGNDQLVGYDGWNGTPTNSGSHGIDGAAVEGLGKSAFIGFGRPGTSSTATVIRPISHNPGNGEPIVRLVAVVGINDSDNSPIPGVEPPRDNFFITFVNSAGVSLASLNFNNTDAGFGLWRDDGIDAFDTTEEFIRGEAQILFAEVDFAANTWTVELDGFPVFRDAPFTAKTGVAMDLGGTAIVWQRGGTFQWGNNWMLFDDWSVSVDAIKAIIPEEPFKITDITRDTANCAQLTWRAQPGFSYRVEYTDDFITWRADLPDSVKTEPVEQNTTYKDLTSPGIPARAYRVVRTRGS